MSGVSDKRRNIINTTIKLDPEIAKGLETLQLVSGRSYLCILDTAVSNYLLVRSTPETINMGRQNFRPRTSSSKVVRNFRISGPLRDSLKELQIYQQQDCLTVMIEDALITYMISKGIMDDPAIRNPSTPPIGNISSSESSKPVRSRKQDPSRRGNSNSLHNLRSASC